jgi:hypothetical protein
MSTYQTAAVYDEHLIGPPRRPTTLTAAVATGLGAAVLNIVVAIIMFASMTDIVRNQIANNPEFGGDPISPDQVDMTAERAHSLETILSSLAGAMIFWAVVLAVLAYFALRGGRTVRVLSTIILVVTALFKAVDVFTTLPATVMALDGLVGFLAPVAIVLFFLPASNAYGKRRRAQRARG